MSVGTSLDNNSVASEHLPMKTSSCDSNSQAEPKSGTPLMSLEYRVAERTKTLAEEATTLAQQAIVLAEQASERIKSLAVQATALAEQAALLDLTHDSIIVRDKKDCITFWNLGAAYTYGWSAEQALGRVTHELLQTRFSLPLDQIQTLLLLDGHWEGELVHTRADKSKITVASRWALQRDGEGNPRGVLEINNDITERKRAEDALRLSEERLALLIQGGKNLAIFMLNPDGLVDTWNEGAQRIKGYISKEIIGQNFSKFYIPEAIEQGRPADVLRIASEDGTCEDEGWRVRKDGSRFWASVVVTALWDKAGKLRGFSKVTRDFTDRRQAEMLLEETRQEQMRFKDEFLSHVSHELRSPLAAIDSFSSIIADGLAGETTPEQDTYLQIILKNSSQLKSMVEDLLEGTRSKSGQLRINLEPVFLSRPLLDVYNTFKGAAAAKEVKLTVELARDLPEAYADETRLLQVLIILCDNAIKFTALGGEVKIKASICVNAPEYLLIQISDTGCGISPDAVTRIFEHHYQASEPGVLGRRGLGLGLHIAKSLVCRQGGEIWASSVLNHGTTLSFTLPIYSETKTNPVAALLLQPV